MTAPVFHHNWTDSRVKTWFPYLESLQNEAAVAVEIGTFEGRTARWLLENILVHPNSHLHCIDPYHYEGRTELKTVDRAKDLAQRNLAAFADRCTIHHDYSYNVLPVMPDDWFDLIYVDGDHSAAACFYDMCHAYRMLKPGGIVIVDDIAGHEREKWGANCPLVAVNTFMQLGLAAEMIWTDKHTAGIQKLS